MASEICFGWNQAVLQHLSTMSCLGLSHQVLVLLWNLEFLWMHSWCANQLASVISCRTLMQQGMSGLILRWLRVWLVWVQGLLSSVHLLVVKVTEHVLWSRKAHTPWCKHFISELLIENHDLPFAGWTTLSQGTLQTLRGGRAVPIASNQPVSIFFVLDVLGRRYMSDNVWSSSSWNENVLTHLNLRWADIPMLVSHTLIRLICSRQLHFVVKLWCKRYYAILLCNHKSLFVIVCIRCLPLFNHHASANADGGSKVKTSVTWDVSVSNPRSDLSLMPSRHETALLRSGANSFYEVLAFPVIWHHLVLFVGYLGLSTGGSPFSLRSQI